ncbi:hypothetical protein PROH_12310 [Prochlorothrix hollandica PCC 9006 = CALU 1027]|uniref:Uncharacterized protein n=1 Tax=Prochlorothrix hollandica PCC 9006 = CALU 1027 TaxID=317619 RepID=A0A0M2Q0E6_PROHO|nr:hypothetical protein PROH_12310 [Prochlorothrix hollandica PCC 9006 = CALU 1027]
MLPESADPPSSLPSPHLSPNPGPPHQNPVLPPGSAPPTAHLTLGNLVGVAIAALTLIFPLLAIMQYSASGIQSNPSLLLPVEAAPQ